MIQRKAYERRTDQEWLDIIYECRSSGLTDKAWCEQHQIDPSSFYNHIRKLRRKSYDIPKPTFTGNSQDRQEVVPLLVQDDEETLPVCEVTPDKQSWNGGKVQPAVRLRIRHIKVEILNGADSSVINDTLAALQCLC